MNSTKLFLIFFITANLFSLDFYAQRVSVSGIIIDSRSGEKVKNVNIFESFSEIGTISDDNGNFYLLLSPGKVQLSFNDDGYKQFVKEFNLESDTLISVKMEIDKPLRNKIFNSNKQEENQSALNDSVK